ncbi:hypothetical protein Tco_1229175 [Tanacetum coccineum]
MGRDKIRLENAVSTISQEYLLEFTSEYGIPEGLHPELPGPEETIVEFPEGKVGVYTKFFEFANFRIPISQFLFDILGHYQIHLSQLSVIGAAKVDEKIFPTVSWTAAETSKDGCQQRTPIPSRRDSIGIHTVPLIQKQHEACEDWTRPRAAHEVPLLTVTASHVIEMEDAAVASESSETPSTIEKSPLDFANEDPPQTITKRGRTKIDPGPKRPMKSLASGNAIDHGGRSKKMPRERWPPWGPLSSKEAATEILTKKVATTEMLFLDKLSVDFDEELYPHMLTAITGHRWVIRHGLRLAVMKCAESSDIRHAFDDVVSTGLAKGMGECLKYGIEHEKAGRDLANIEAYDPDANSKLVKALQDLKDLKYPMVDQLERLKDAPMELIMASLHLESDTVEDALQWIRDLRLSSSQLKIPVYPEVRDPKDPWAVKEEMLLEDAIAANIRRAEKKKKCRVVCRTHEIGFAHHTRSDGIPVSAPTIVPQWLAILLADAATQTEVGDKEEELHPRLQRSILLPPVNNL